jgi:hypothetical protein
MKVFCGPHDRPAFVNDAAREQQPPAWSQDSISVDHEGLLFVEVKW